MDEFIAADIKKKIPSITDEELDALMEKLKELGARNLEMLRQEGAVSVDDLKGIIPPIMARVLISKWLKGETAEEDVRVENQPAAAISSSANFVLPQIDFDDLQEMKTIISQKNISKANKKKVLRAVADLVMRTHRLTRNFPIESWCYVAETLAKKNDNFYDSNIANDNPSKTVVASSTCMSSHVGHKLTYNKNQNEQDEPKKAKKSNEVQRDEYGCREVDYNVLADTEENLKKFVTKLQDEYELDPTLWNMLYVVEKMKVLFKTMHYSFHVTKMDCSEAKTTYPFFFEGNFMLDFFFELTDIAAEDALQKFVEVNLAHAYAYFTRFGTRRDRDDFIEIDKQLIAAEKDPGHTQQPKLIAVLMMAFIHLHDGEISSGDFITCVEVI